MNKKEVVTIKDVSNTIPHNQNVLNEEVMQSLMSDTTLPCTNLVLLQILDYSKIERIKTNNFEVTLVTEDISTKQKGKTIIVYSKLLVFLFFRKR